jgi:hypothetical protein
MSDTLYYITAKSKGEKPFVMFYSYDSQWHYSCANARILDLHTVKNNAEHEPTHCLFVEATDGLQHIVGKYFEKEKQLSYKVFKALIKEQNCETISTRKEKKPKMQAAPEVSRSFIAGELIVRGQGKHKIEIWDEPQDEAKPEPTLEEKREYVLFYSQKYASGYTYYLRGGGETFDKSEAYRMTHLEAIEKAKDLSARGQYQWIYRKIDAEQETLTPEAEPAPKKRIGYVLFGELTNSTKIYRHETKIVALLNAALDDAEPADVYMTKEQAEFIAYTVNKCEPEFVTWQVEQIEF